ncbi:MAG: IS3 family transposase [Gemmataceae bacterium]
MERSSFYYTAAPEPDDGVRSAVVKIAAEFPSYGYRMIRGELRRRGFDVNAKRVRRLMREENLVIQVRRLVATSEYCPNHGDWPNLVKSRAIATLNDVWAADITYIDLGREFVYLAVILDLHSRGIRGWWLDRDLSSALTHRALDRALAKHEAPKIHHSDHGAVHGEGLRGEVGAARHRDQHVGEGKADAERLLRALHADAEGE